MGRRNLDVELVLLVSALQPHGLTCPRGACFVQSCHFQGPHASPLLVAAVAMPRTVELSSQAL